MIGIFNKNKKNIQYSVIDNFLTEEEFSSMKNDILSKKFPWYLNPTKVKNPDRWRNLPNLKWHKSNYKKVDKYNYQLFHMFVKDNENKSQFINTLNPIFDKLKVKEKIRIKANLTPRTDNLIEYDFHVDTKKGCYTAVFYMNKNNGYTLFSNGEKIYSNPNKILIFNSNELHAGSSCTNSQARIVININFTSDLTFF